MGEKQPGRIGHGGVRRVVCFQAVTEADVVHMRTVTGGGAASVKLEQFRAANTFLGNSKAAFCSTFYAFDFANYADRYLADFVPRRTARLLL